jgi:hypothetical protein
MRIANLTAEQLEKVKELETDLGTWVVAVEPEIRLADLTEAQVKKLQAVEKELGVILLAYEAA